MVLCSGCFDNSPQYDSPSLDTGAIHLISLTPTRLRLAELALPTPLLKPAGLATQPGRLSGGSCRSPCRLSGGAGVRLIVRLYGCNSDTNSHLYKCIPTLFPTPCFSLWPAAPAKPTFLYRGGVASALLAAPTIFLVP